MKQSSQNLKLASLQKQIYNSKTIKLNKPTFDTKISRSNTCAVLGIQLGDEGKGRIVDNKIQEILSNNKIKKIYVIRSQGGNNAGHTVEKGKVKNI